MPRYDSEFDKSLVLLEALATGDVGGAIERSEARGQAALVHGDDLPTDMDGVTQEEVTEATGIVFGEKVDHLLTRVTLPAGWSKRRTDHAMHSELVDDKGRVRAGIFYKAAFYDRRADMYFRPFWRIETAYHDAQNRPKWIGNGENPEFNGKLLRSVVILDGFGAEAMRYEPIGADDYTDEAFAKDDENKKAARAWLDANHPDWRSPFAYWTAEEAA